MTSRRMIDWTLAERIATGLAGTGSGRRSVRQRDVDEHSAGTVELVCEYTGLRPEEPMPHPEAVTRPEWIRANLRSLEGMSAEVEDRLVASLDLPGPLGSAGRRIAGIAAGIELGLATAFVSQRVLGQYDVAMMGPGRPPRLLFVAPNLADAHRRMGGDRGLLLRWIALHEATHAVQFGAVPWLRPHIGAMTEEILAGAAVGIRPADAARAARSALRPDGLRRLARTLRRGDLASLFISPARLRTLRRLQATMTVVEGYSEHVMDAVGEQLDPAYRELRELAESERDRGGAIDAAIARLLGLDVKLRQYRVGKRFCDAVADRAGVEGLNRVWEAPQALPRPSELEHPGRWMSRVGLGRARAAA
jgi:coenzyme F420 biosynthesis associated uncharacterized protein